MWQQLDDTYFRNIHMVHDRVLKNKLKNPCLSTICQQFYLYLVFQSFEWLWLEVQLFQQDDWILNFVNRICWSWYPRETHTKANLLSNDDKWWCTRILWSSVTVVQYSRRGIITIPTNEYVYGNTVRWRRYDGVSNGNLVRTVIEGDCRHPQTCVNDRISGRWFGINKSLGILCGYHQLFCTWKKVGAQDSSFDKF